MRGNDEARDEPCAHSQPSPRESLSSPRERVSARRTALAASDAKRDAETDAILTNVSDALAEFKPKVPGGGGRGFGQASGGPVGGAGGGRGAGGKGKGGGIYGPGGGVAGLLTTPPPAYVCHRCGKTGHFIRECLCGNQIFNSTSM